ncbi:MAG: ATP-binding protein, partial [Vicinamibacterales bacterium]
ISLTVSPILHSSGRVAAAAKIARDITDQMRQRAIVDEASRLTTSFLAVLSHEVRTLLNGIAAEHLLYVFQRFWQAHTGASREFAGLGIGLTLARHLDELHGGEISLLSEGPGHGAIFTVALPTGPRVSTLSTLPRVTERTR